MTLVSGGVVGSSITREIDRASRFAPKQHFRYDHQYSYQYQRNMELDVDNPPAGHPRTLSYSIHRVRGDATNSPAASHDLKAHTCEFSSLFYTPSRVKREPVEATWSNGQLSLIKEFRKRASIVHCAKRVHVWCWLGWRKEVRGDKAKDHGNCGTLGKETRQGNSGELSAILRPAWAI